MARITTTRGQGRAVERLVVLGDFQEQFRKRGRVGFFQMPEPLVLVDGEHDHGRLAATGYALRVAGEGGIDHGAEAVLGVL